jgi:hypothetical protein
MTDRGLSIDEHHGEQGSVMRQEKNAPGEEKGSLRNMIVEPGSSTTYSPEQVRLRAIEPMLPSLRESPPHPNRGQSTIRFNDGYLDRWRQQNKAKISSTPPKRRGKWEGVWLAKGTLRRVEEPGEDLWKFLWRKLKKAEAVDAGSQHEHVQR